MKYRAPVMRIKDSAMRPLHAPLTLSAAVFFASWFGNIMVQVWGFLIFMAMLLFWGKTYWHFAKKDPDRLETKIIHRMASGSIPVSLWKAGKIGSHDER